MVVDTIVVHIGAGNHSEKFKSNYKILIEKALSSNDFFEVSKILEHSPLTNTGFGSSINLEGKVECDASFINYDKVNKKKKIGSAFEICNSLHPISEIFHLYEKIEKFFGETKNKHLYLSKPVILSHKSITEKIDFFRNEKNKIKDVNLILKKSKRIYDFYKNKCVQNISFVENKKINDVTDTIGILKINEFETKIATSSGGHFLKLPGRIGCAALIGSSIDFRIDENYEISCMCSGNGEDIIQMQLANFIVNKITTDSYPELSYGEILVNIIKSKSHEFVLESKNEIGEPILYLGVILVIKEIKNNKSFLVYFHSTKSFFFGYKNSNNKKNVFLSKLNSKKKSNNIFAFGEICIN